MKRKMSQILMLLAIVVTMGAVVSCRDVYEDLSNEIGLPSIGSGDNFKQAMEKQMKALQDQLDAYKAQLDAINSCTCDKNALEETLNSLRAAIEALEAEKASATDLAALNSQIESYKTALDELTSNYSTLTNIVMNDRVAKSELEQAVQTLQAQIDALKNGGGQTVDLTEILERLTAAETAAQEAKSLAEDASSRITVVEQDAAQALSAALSAVEAAQAAQEAAETASAAAGAASIKAGEAKTAADEAKALATEVMTIASTNAENLAKLEERVAKNESDIAKNMQDIAKNAQDIASNTERITALEQQLVTMNETLQEAYTTASNAFAQAQGNKALIDSLSNVTTTNGEAISALQESLNKLQQQVDAIVVPDYAKELEKLKGNVKDLQDVVGDLYTTVDSLGNEINVLKDEIKELYNYADDNLEKAKAYTDLEIALLKKLLTDRFGEASGRLDGVDEKLAALGLKVDGMDDYMKEILLARIEAAEGRLDGVEGDVADLSYLVSQQYLEVINRFEGAEGRLDELEALVAALGNKTITIGDVEGLLDKLTELEGKDADLEGQITTLGDDIETLNETVEGLQEQLDAFDEKLDDIIEKLADVEKKLKELQDALAKQVTSVILQGTYNPAFGSLRLPTGLQTNILVAYYGEPVNPVEFPTARTANYVKDADTLTIEDMEIIGKEGIYTLGAQNTLMMSEEGNAGTLYMTVNPNTVDFTGYTPAIVNSQDKESPIKLGGLQKSDKVLQFGFTRGADNGFYEAAATVAPEDIAKVQKVNFNKGALKDAIKEIAQKRTGADLTSISNDIYDVLTGAKLDASAIKCEYTDVIDDVETTHAVYSNYGLAATAAKPLSFNTLATLHVDNTPGIGKVNGLLDRVASTVKSKFRTAIDGFVGSDLVEHVQGITINNIEIADLSEELLAKFMVKIDTVVTINGLEYTLDLHENVSVPINFDQSLKGIKVEIPTLALSSTGDDPAVLVVPLLDKNGNKTGQTVEITMDQVKVEGQTITLGDEKITIDKTVETTVDISKVLKFGDLDENGNHTNKKTIVLTIHQDMRPAAEELWGEAQTALGNVNDMLDEIRRVLDDVNVQLDKINGYKDKVDDAVDSALAGIKEYLEKLNSSIASLINGINGRLQPVMLASTKKGTKTLSGAKSYPTVLTTSATFVPTSYTYELIVPICKKHVAVTNVFKGKANAHNNADCKALADAVNSQEGMNEVVSGNVREIKASNLKPGYTYEFAYSALDYHGLISTHKYYVTVK